MTAAPYRQPFPAASPRALPIAVPVEETSQFQRMGFVVMLVFIFLTFSRVFDVKFGSLHITGIAIRVVTVLMLLSRSFQVALKSRIGKALLGFTICFGLSVPFSIWRTGSKDQFQAWVLLPFTMHLVVSGMIGSYEQCAKAIKVLAIALLVFMLIANIFGAPRNGRLYLDQGKFSNPNEMAQALLLGLPLWGAMMARSKAGLGKVFAVGVMAMILLTTFRTGSRGAMIGFVAMLLAVFLRASIVDKMKLVMVSILFMGIVVTTMPGKLISRYKSAVNEEEVEDGEMDAAMASSAADSTQSRKQLLKHSLIFTVKHPLFGVGAGMFVVADDSYVKSLGGRKGNWLGTHNAYTQVSSELGIPALLFFVSTIVMSLTATNRVYQKTRGDPRLEDMGQIAMGLHYCLVIYGVTIMFEHIAYTIMLPVFAGLAAALLRTAEVEIQRIQANPPDVMMTTSSFHNYLAARPRRAPAARPAAEPAI